MTERDETPRDAISLDAYQRAAERTVNLRLSTDDRLLDAVAGLAEEAGEALAYVRKHRFQARVFERERFVSELGDALWCLAVAASSAGLTLDEIARANIAKLEARHPNGFTTNAPHAE